MTFANCPKCGSSNVTTAGVCANCGWVRFPQAMGAGESKEAIYNLVGEIEIKVTGKALLDDYRRLLFENDKLTARIAELEAVVDKLVWSVEGRVEFMYSKHQREFEDIVAEYKEREEAESERFTVHSGIERQDDKSPNDTQTQTIVYGKESEE